MQWRKLGLVWRAQGTPDWRYSHAGLPTPIDIGGGILRVFIYSQSTDAIGRIGYVDVSAQDPRQVLGHSTAPVLDIGPPGAFDDHGVVPVSVVRVADGRLYLYFVGFELCRQIRYRLFTGLAISSDNGASFVKVSQAPVLDRSDRELFFRCGSHVRYENGGFKLWYIGGDAWMTLHNKQVPVYDMRYLESDDGIHWAPSGEVVMRLDPEREHGFGRPYVVEAQGGGYEMFYSVRSLSTADYRMGYATSDDGRRWLRQDQDLGLALSASGWDSEAQCFPAVIRVEGQRYMFYNGNNFGADGFGVALQEE
jgi:hypothetical protein